MYFRITPYADGTGFGMGYEKSTNQYIGIGGALQFLPDKESGIVAPNTKSSVPGLIAITGNLYIHYAVQFVDFDKLGTCTGLPELQLAKEQEIVKIFPDYPLGAEPPFGHLYGLKVIMDRQVETNHDITFNAGTHTDIIKMKLKDFLLLENPIIGDIGVHI